MGKAYYDIVGQEKHWAVLHDGEPEGDYVSKEAAFEAACAAASNAIKFGHEVRVTVPGRDEAGGSALGVASN
ncbi:hypothetical protein [Rhodopseudomonas palustris]|uniref:DUF2188 domain-containing protein n=1 Tax=Rhodopseudomonas palustris (strain BisB18) TaxID=316056 RepID=Q210M3_RHOPB